MKRGLMTPTPLEPALASSLSRYIARRHFTSSSSTTSSPSSSPSTIPLSQFALRSLVLGAETSTNDAVQFACSTSDPIQIEQQYSKFKIWISESPDSFKPELAQLLYPTFTHLYLQLVSSGQRQFAQKFHKRHQSTFLGNVEFASFIRQLAPILSPDDISADETVSSFHSSKYSVTLSNKTYHFLMRYLLACNSHPILLHVLRFKVDLKLADALGASSKTEALRRMEQDSSEIHSQEASLVSSRSASSISATEVTGRKETKAREGAEEEEEEETRSKLLETIQTVRDGSTSLPTSCLFKLNHPYSHFACSTISSDCSRLAAGAENSSVNVWNLVPQQRSQSSMVRPRTNKRRRRRSRIMLGCDLMASFASRCDRETEEETGETEPPSDVKTLLGHRGPVYDVAFVESVHSGNGGEHHLLSVSEDTTMRIWDLNRQANVAVYRGHSYPIWSLDVDSLGINVSTGSMDRTAKLWHLEYTHPIRTYAGHEGDVDVVKFHPNCNYLATGSVDKSVRLWSHADAKMVRVYTGHRGCVHALSFSPDGRLLASAGEDRRVRVWDLAASAVLKELKGHSDTVTALAWSADSSMLASAGMDGTVRLWDVKRGLPTPQDAAATDGGGELEGSANLAASFPSWCTNILDLRYSRHNTLMVTGNSASAAPAAPAISSSTSAATTAEDGPTYSSSSHTGTTMVNGGEETTTWKKNYTPRQNI